MSFTFTVTQQTQNFTATISFPINLTLEENPDTVAVINSSTTITVINNVQPVTISGVGGGNAQFNQSLNTTDNVSFASVTTPAIYGVAQQPVSFPTGISVANLGNTFVGGIDLGSLNVPYTNQVSLLLALIPIDLGRALQDAGLALDFGSV